MKNNFLNNQNYILGETEKKKLLSKFLTELQLQKKMNLLSEINAIFSNETLVRMSPILFYLIGVIFFNFPQKSFVIFIGYFIGGFFIKRGRDGYFKIKNLKDFFFGGNKHFIFLYAKILFSLAYGFYFFTLLGIDGNSWFSIVFSIIFVIVFVLFLLFLNILNTLFYPVLLLYTTVVYLIFRLWNVFFMNSGYKFVKLLPESNIFKSFEMLNHNCAENKYYKIKLKK